MTRVLFFVNFNRQTFIFAEYDWNIFGNIWIREWIQLDT